MARDPAPNPRRNGLLRRSARALTRPSTRWSILSLLGVGFIAASAAVIGTQVMVGHSGTTEFCSTSCHSMQWVAAEYSKSPHHLNRTGVTAGCSDCHVPHAYPRVLFYKLKAGVHDAIAEAQGVIGTEEKFKKERLRLAKNVWAEYKAEDSARCRTCHQFSPAILEKQKDFVRPMHEQVLAGAATCIDCHKGIAHTAPDE
jgi:cytochrome c-type protein NapC